MHQMWCVWDVWSIDSGGTDMLLLEHSLLSGLPDLMAKVAQEEMESLEGAISECSVVYFPQVRHNLTFINVTYLTHIS